MRRLIVAGLVLLVLPVAAAAQSTPKPGPVPLEIRKREGPPEAKAGRPVVPPAPQSPSVVREADRAVADLERAERDEKLLREQARKSPARPDLGYDVQSGIQQRNVQRALTR